MPSPAVTLCERSYYGVRAQPGRFAGHYPSEGCDNPIAPCSVRDVEHKGHDWLFTAEGWRAPRLAWRHCNGVSSVEERAAG